MTIIEAIDARDRDAVYRFRYKVYAEEMGRPQAYADHEWKRIEEPLDASGHVLAAYNNVGRIVGTVRYNVGVDDTFGIYRDLYRLPAFGGFFPDHVSITTKLMVARDFRHTRLAVDLAMACYRAGLELETCFDSIDCNPPLVSFFKRLGYRQLWPEVEHPEYGRVVPLVLVLNDKQYLQDIRSPFAGIAAEYEDRYNAVAFFTKELCSDGLRRGEVMPR